MRVENGVPTMLTWAENLLKNSQKVKKKIIKDVLKNILNFKFFMGKRAEQDQPDEEEMALFSLLTSDEVKLMGFAPNFSYISPTEKNAQYVHAFGTYTLAFAHKKLPVILLVNPTLLVDDSILRLVKNEKDILKELKVKKGQVVGATS